MQPTFSVVSIYDTGCLQPNLTVVLTDVTGSYKKFWLVNQHCLIFSPTGGVARNFKRRGPLFPH